jgi:recombination protein RecR
MRKADYPEAVQHLILHLRQLPGVGPRGAERIALWMLQGGRAAAADLAASVGATLAGVANCPVCGFFSAAGGACPLCDDPARDRSLLCIVEQPSDVLPIERTGAFAGLYHVLGGKLSPLDNVGPDQLRLAPLRPRLCDGVAEVILALGSDVEGEATCHYLRDHLAGCPCRVTRLAQGMPAGGGLESADTLTLLRAMAGRRILGE